MLHKNVEKKYLKPLIYLTHKKDQDDNLGIMLYWSLIDCNYIYNLLGQNENPPRFLKLDFICFI